ncbi:thiol peroxidase [Tessaracoccus sp. ZS01]|uniref:thiol peroxidase n=1 Tax=Tessaracoccus sp. ZS01 TaxID=1906324 RepID=UPI00096F185F|nr:thiol peroxidase [Tessaracoccus sp. ZS01]MCG6567790.1 thiol peroxidase [Tessaracoccus sp. ZS01]OMG55526.1 lipid hydroperoxide peroxidase [Tessaracoccus sp. ZS01]
MADITHKGNPVRTVGELPAVGSTAPDFVVTGTDLAEVRLSDFAGRKLLISIFPSLDTGVCATSLRTFNESAAGLEGATVLNVSRDLPFAHARFCESEGIDNVVVASDFRTDFGENYGVTLETGALKGLLSRSVIVIDEDGKVVYTEQVPEIGQEPDYQAALAALN